MGEHEPNTARQRADVRWSDRARRNAVPWPCTFCTRSFKTKWALTRHTGLCWKNPDCRQFATGTHRPIMRNGRIIGYIWNGNNDMERAAIQRGFDRASEALGFLGDIS
jgi:hypothetical protein